MRIFFIIISVFSSFSAIASGTAGLNYQTYRGTGASPDRVTLTYPTVLSTGVSDNINYPTSSSFGTTILNSGRTDQVIVKWTGYINIATAGSYTFGGSADDGIYVTVNNTVVIDSWIESSNEFRVGSPITLPVGVVPITVWYYDNEGDQTVVLKWSENGTWQVVPTDVFATDPAYFSSPTTPSAVYSNYSITTTQQSRKTLNQSSNSNGHNATVDVVGNDNLVTIQQIGSNGHFVDLSVEGNINNVDILQTSNTTSRHYMEVTVLGGNNNLTLQQRDTDKTQFIAVNGDYNTISVDQRGLGNHFLDLSVSGNNHTTTIIQNGSGSHNARVVLDGSQPWTFTLNQNSETGQTYNLPHSLSDGSLVSGTCSTIGGCNLTVNQ